MKIVSSEPPAAEHELSSWVDPYLRDQLSQSQRERFEQALISDQRLQDLTRQSYLLSELSNEFPEQLGTAPQWLRRPVLAYAIAASLGAALVALPAWWVQQELRREQGHLAQQLAQAQQSIAALAAPQPGLAVLRLGATRSGQAPDALLRQSEGIHWAQLVLPYLAPNGQEWPADAVVELLAEGDGPSSRFPLTALRSAEGPSLLFPLANMPRGVYRVAVTEQGQALGEYRFELLADQASDSP